MRTIIFLQRERASHARRASSAEFSEVSADA
jgi:hypothetical protein